MKQEPRAIRHRKLGFVAATVLAGAALTTALSPVVAQQQVPEVVTVTAPRVVKQTIGRSTTGAPVELTSIARGVSYADLDLSSPVGANELKNRIDTTAANLCKELDQLFPLQPSDPKCARSAASRAMAEADKVIAAASAR